MHATAGSGSISVARARLRPICQAPVTAGGHPPPVASPPPLGIAPPAHGQEKGTFCRQPPRVKRPPWAADQSPGLVRKLKARAPDVQVLKVLHVKGGECLEGSLIGAYETAGTDAFLFDVVADDGRVGSTGLALDPAIATALTADLNLPFLIA